jgi:hypothetical protein
MVDLSIFHGHQVDMKRKCQKTGTEIGGQNIRGWKISVFWVVGFPCPVKLLWAPAMDSEGERLAPIVNRQNW